MVEKSRIVSLNDDNVVLKLSRKIDAKILILISKLMDAVDEDRDDLYIPKPDADPLGIKITPTPWPSTPYPPGTVVCYGCGPVIYGTDFGGFKSVCTTELNITGIKATDKQ